MYLRTLEGLGQDDVESADWEWGSVPDTDTFPSLPSIQSIDWGNLVKGAFTIYGKVEQARASAPQPQQVAPLPAYASPSVPTYRAPSSPFGIGTSGAVGLALLAAAGVGVYLLLK